MSRGLEAGGTRGRRDAAPASSGSPGGRAGPPPSGGRGQRGQRWKDGPPRCPLGSAGSGCGRPFTRAGPAAATAAARPPRRPREDEKDQAERRRRPRGRAPGRWTRPRAAIADPRPRARPPASAPHLISGRVRAAAPHTNQCSPHAARRNAGSAAAHTIPARPLARLPPGRPGARSGCSLASLRTTEQPSCAPSPCRSTPLALRSFVPSLPPISSSPSAAAPPPTASPPLHP